MTDERTLPGLPGHKTNALGHLVPVSLIPPEDLQKDELVRDIISRAKELREYIMAFKAQVGGDIDAHCDLVAEKYGVKLGGAKGHLKLRSFDGKYVVEIDANERFVFDEKLQAARALIDQCLERWTAGSRDEIKALVHHAFQTDKEGRINQGRILSLTRVNIDDDGWRSAMQAVKDSLMKVGTKRYMRLYERDDKGKMNYLSMDFASI